MSDRLLTISGPSMPVGTLAYIATPYTRYEGGNIELAFREAARISAALMVAGIDVFSPIVHSHPLALYGEGVDALDRNFWLNRYEIFMARCDALIVVEMKDWKESIGIAHEIKFFLERKRTIFQLDPVQMTIRRVIFPASEVFERSAAS
jgi:hypothetical protein